MAAGGKWDSTQNLNGTRVEWPTGPLELGPNEIPYWIEAWVVQRSTGASQRSDQSSGWGPATKWIADGNVWKQGDFIPGPAVGIALLAVRNPGPPVTSAFYWWVDMFDLI